MGDIDGKKRLTSNFDEIKFSRFFLRKLRVAQPVLSRVWQHVKILRNFSFSVWTLRVHINMAPTKEEKKFLLEVIDRYRQLPALWKIKSDDYSNRNKKEQAYESLLQKYREWYKEATKDDLKEKTIF